jgi:hypothetical protein
MLNLTIESKRDRLKMIMARDFQFKISRFDDHCFPNKVNGELVLEDREGRMPDLVFEKVVSIEEIPNTTDYAYDLTVEETRTFDCYNAVTQFDTFHNIGNSSKTNVTRGVPRIEEILRLTKNPKNPSMTVFMKSAEEHDQSKAEKYLAQMTHTRLGDVVRSIRVCFDPHEETSEIEGDRRLMDQFFAFEQLMVECGAEVSPMDPKAERSRWILRLEFDAETLLEKQITMDDLHYAIVHSAYGADLECVFSDYNSDQLVCRIRTTSATFGKKKGAGAGARGKGKGKGGEEDEGAGEGAGEEEEEEGDAC